MTNYINILMDLLQPASILDVGCYHDIDGVQSLENIKKFENTKFILLEENLYLYNELRKKLDNLRKPYTLILYDITPVNKNIKDYVTDDKFDLIICQNILHFIDNYEIKNILNKISSFLDDNGHLYIRNVINVNKLNDEKRYDHQNIISGFCSYETELVHTSTETHDGIKYKNYIFKHSH